MRMTYAGKGWLGCVVPLTSHSKHEDAGMPKSLPQDKQLIHRVLAALYGKPCRRYLVCLMEITDVSEFDWEVLKLRVDVQKKRCKIKRADRRHVSRPTEGSSA